jgi:hypothetical protein
MIELHFANPCDEWAQNTIDKIAINYDVSVERAGIIMLENLITSLSRRSEESGQSYIDDQFGVTYQLFVYAPKATVGQYKENGYIYPKIILSEDYVIRKRTGEHLPINDDALTYFCKDFEEVFGLEFIKYKWQGPRKWLNSKQTSLF